MYLSSKKLFIWWGEGPGKYESRAGSLSAGVRCNIKPYKPGKREEGGGVEGEVPLAAFSH